MKREIKKYYWTSFLCLLIYFSVSLQTSIGQSKTNENFKKTVLTRDFLKNSEELLFGLHKDGLMDIVGRLLLVRSTFQWKMTRNGNHPRTFKPMEGIL